MIENRYLQDFIYKIKMKNWDLRNSANFGADTDKILGFVLYLKKIKTLTSYKILKNFQLTFLY